MAKIGFDEILKRVTVDSKDDGERFLVRERIDAIMELLSGSEYTLQAEGNLFLLYSKKPLVDRDIVLVSSHIDCVYSRCFCEEEGEFYKGTFDNSITNAAVVYDMLEGRFGDDVVIAFTGDEEKDSRGAYEVMQALYDRGCYIKFAAVTDATQEAWQEGCPFTIENDLGVDLIMAHRIIESLKKYWNRFVLIHDAEPDESWDYCRKDVPVLTLCIPVCGVLHSDEGMLARKTAMPVYCEALAAIVNCI